MAMCAYFATTRIALATLILLSTYTQCIHSAKILLLPTHITSHIMEMLHSVDELRRPSRGHEIHMVIGDSYRVPSVVTDSGIKSLRFKSRHDVHPMQQAEYLKKQNTIILSSSLIDELTFLNKASMMLLSDCLDTVQDTKLVDTVRNMNFDIAVADSFFFCPCSPMLAYHLGIPFVTVGTELNPAIHGDPLLPSFVPSLMSPFSDTMSFVERLQNIIPTIVFLLPLMSGQRDTELMSKYGRTDADRGKLITALPKKCILSIINQDPVLGYPVPTMPRTILAGGLSTTPAKALTPEYDDIIRASEHGIIIVSFGSLVSYLPNDIIDKLADAFSRVKYTVIWRKTGEISNQASDNVYLRKWLPQNDLLANPKTKLFITHSGNNGQFEALYHGVPMVAFYITGDQPHNANRVQHKGFGLKISITDFTADELQTKMEEVIGNATYRINIQKASRIYKDRPMNARETSAYWIEHVIKYGSEHLKSAATELSWYSYLMLDILFLFLLCLVFVIIVLFKCVGFVFGRCASKRPSAPMRKKKQQ